MSLIKCKHCGKRISDTTDKCIHCGEPLTKKRIGKTSKSLIVFFGIIGVLLLGLVFLFPTMNLKNANSVNRSENYNDNQNQSKDDSDSSGFTRYSNTDYFYLPDDKIFVKGTSKVKSFEGQNFSNNLIFAGSGGCTKSYNSIEVFSKLVINNLSKPNSYNTLVYPGDTCGSDIDVLWNVSKYVTFDASACFLNFNGHCASIDMDTYTYPMIVHTGPTYIFYKDAEIYYDTDDDGYGDTLTTGIYISSIKHFHENVGQLLKDGTIIYNDSKDDKEDNSNNNSNNNNNNSNSNSNSNSNNNNNSNSSNNSNSNNNNISNSNSNNNNNSNSSNNSNNNNSNSNNDNNSNNNNSSNNNNTTKPKLYLYKLVFNNFGKYYKDNFGDNGYTNNSIITFYIDGECVTDTKVDDIELRPAGSYYIYSKELSGIVSFDLYIDNKKVDTISVNVDEKMQANSIYMD